jgi:hypothetical protein
MRFVRNMLLSLALSLLVVSQGLAIDRLVTVEGTDPAGIKDVVASLEAVGARVKIVIPPHFIIADVPVGSEGRVIAAPDVTGSYAERLAPEDFARFGEAARHIVTAWNNVYMGESRQAGLDEAPSPGHRPLVNDVIYVDRTGTLMKPPGAKAQDTSEFMLGTVALAVVLAESDGSVDPESEDWTETEKDNVTSEIISGLDWYVNKARWRPLTFYTVFEYDVPTGYEPITRSSAQDDLWIDDCLSYLGYLGSQAYVVALRNQLDTDWAVVNYIADSSNDPDNCFSDGGFAYSMLGGPEFIMTYGNDGWGISNMDAVMAHELSHSFYALDEYSSAGVACSQTAGYLAAENQNSAYPYAGACDLNTPFCIMRSVALGSAQVCYWTKGQIGWWDADDDSICDVNDTYPETELYAHADPCSSFTPAYAGSSSVGFLENLNPRGQQHEITLNRIAMVEYRVDGGDWHESLPNDGAWDQGGEGFHFTTSALSEGEHVIEARAIQTYGNFDTTYAADTLTIDPGSGIDVAHLGAGLAVAPYPNPFGPRVELRFNVPGEEGKVVAVLMSIFDVRGREVRRLIDGLRSSGPGRLSWDGTYANGSMAPSGIYFVELRTVDEKVVRKLVMAR